MNDDAVTSLIADGEGQNTEFKKALSNGCQEEAIRSLVAFANATGGQVLFGVRDDRKISGVDVGKTAIEDLANRITQQTYPQLPVSVSQAQIQGRMVVVAQSYADAPPLVGVYLKSKRRLDPDEPVSTADLDVFRRVGRTDQSVALDMVRQDGPHDPDVVVLRGGATTRGDRFPVEWVFTYRNSGPGWAYGASFSAKHPDAQFSVSVQGIDLPPAGQDDPRHELRPREALIHLESDPSSGSSAEPVLLTVTYQDQAGCSWKSTIELQPDQKLGYSVGRRERQIMMFPSKRRWSGGA